METGPGARRPGRGSNRACEEAIHYKHAGKPGDPIAEREAPKRAAINMGVKSLIEKASALHYTTAMEKELSPDWAKSQSPS